MIYYSNNKKDTQKIASDLAAKIKSGLIILEGELGAGKTTFIQAFAKALRIKSKIKSPTFNILKKYEIPNSNIFFYHIDCYRLKDHKDAEALGFKDIFKNKDSLVMIEWPERIRKILPKRITTVHIDHTGENKRKIKITKF